MEEWFSLIYKIPSEPTRYRASVWRKVKASGAVYLQNSVCVLPGGSKGSKGTFFLLLHIQALKTMF